MGLCSKASPEAQTAHRQSDMVAIYQLNEVHCVFIKIYTISGFLCSITDTQLFVIPADINASHSTSQVTF